MPGARSPTRCRGGGRRGRSRCCAARATTAATVSSRRASSAERGWPVRLALLGARRGGCTAMPRRLRRAGRARSSRWRRRLLDGAGLVVDAHLRRGSRATGRGHGARGHRGARRAAAAGRRDRRAERHRRGERRGAGRSRRARPSPSPSSARSRGICCCRGAAIAARRCSRRSAFPTAVLDADRAG